MAQDNINVENNNNMDKPKTRGRPKKTPDNKQPENKKADKKESKQDIKTEEGIITQDKTQDIKKVKADKPKTATATSEQKNILKRQKALNKVKEAEQQYLEAIKQLQPQTRKQTKTQREPKKNALTRTDDFLLRHDPLL